MLKENKCTEIVIMMKLENGKGKMVRALLDSGCSKTIVLKEFTQKKRRKVLPPEEHIKYKTYGGYFRSKLRASIQFKLVEFETYKDRLIEYEVQVDEQQKRKDTSYDIIIGTDLMNDLGINLMFAENVISIGKGKEKDFVPMKSLGMLTDIETSQCIYDMHVQAPILQQEEERQKKLLDANYSKVDIDQMVKDLDISKSLKEKLKYMLNNHKTLFSGGLGKVDMKPINIKLKKGSKC